MIRGIDVSHHNGPLDWHALAASLRLDFAFAKATEAEGFTDPRFRSNWAGIAEAGLVRGAYHFARPDADPRDDAQRFVAAVKAAGSMHPTDLVGLDLEVTPPPGVSLHGWATGWAAEVRRLLTGYSIGIYHQDKPAGFDWQWLAEWPGRASWPTSFNPQTSARPLFWQWTNNVLGRGIDADVFNGTRAQLEALNPGARPTPTPTPKPTVRTITRLLQVTKPHFLTGSDVKAVQRLVGMNVADQDGGYDYQTAWHVGRWQASKHLLADGKFGKQSTLAAGWRWAG
jgi:hypothetical protein